MLGKFATGDAGAHTAACGPSSVGSRGPIMWISNNIRRYTQSIIFLYPKMNLRILSFQSYSYTPPKKKETQKSPYIHGWNGMKVEHPSPVLELLVVNFKKWCGDPQLLVLLRKKIVSGCGTWRSQSAMQVLNGGLIWFNGINGKPARIFLHHLMPATLAYPPRQHTPE